MLRSMLVTLWRQSPGPRCPAGFSKHCHTPGGVQFASNACSITTKAVKTASSSADDKLLQQHAHLRDLLQSQGLTFSAMMAVLKQNHKQKLCLENVQNSILQLSNVFGIAAVSDMLTLSPQLVTRHADRLIANYKGLVDMFGAGEAFALNIVKRAPDVLQHNVETIRARMVELQKMFQIEHKDLLRLIKKAPTLLKCRTERCAANLKYLAEVGGLSPYEVFKVFISWPIMCTTTTVLVKQRYATIMQLLEASPADMARICRTFPNVLGRDPAQLAANIATMAQQLKLSKDQLVYLVRREPGLLSWNVSTLVTRFMTVSQMLKLSPELRVTLLSYNRSLLNNHMNLPQRLEVLQRLMNVSEEELYPLVHKNLPVLRFSVESIDAKLACASSLSMLHPRWVQEWEAHSPLGKMRALQAGWACYWRLVYLLFTGQQGTVSFAHAMRMPNNKFKGLYPDFYNWLVRYNHAVTSKEVPLLTPGDSKGVTLTGPSTYTPILPDATMGKALHSGSLYVRNKMAALHQQSALPVTDSSSDTASSRTSSTFKVSHSGIAGGTGSDSSHESSSSRTFEDIDNSRAHNSNKAVLELPASPAGYLAGWLGVELAVAEELLGRVRSHVYAARLSWAAWQARICALQSLLAVLDYCPPPAAPSGPQQWQRSGSGMSGSEDTTTLGAAMVATATAVDVLASSMAPDSPLLSGILVHRNNQVAAWNQQQQQGQKQEQQEQQLQQQQALAGISQQHRSAHQFQLPPSACDTHHEQQQPEQQQLQEGHQQQEQQHAHRKPHMHIHMQQPEQQKQQQQQGQQQQWQLQSQRQVVFTPLPEVQAALRYAESTGQAAAVAGVSVACHLAPFMQQLYMVPPRPPDAVVQFLLADLDIFVKKTFEANCRRFAVLAAASTELRHHLQALDTKQLAKYLGCCEPRLQYLQFLVQTQQPTPWEVDLRRLLLSTKWYLHSKLSLREKMRTTYPDYERWEAAMKSL